jgi:hypothetical protein
MYKPLMRCKGPPGKETNFELFSFPAPSPELLKFLLIGPSVGAR